MSNNWIFHTHLTTIAYMSLCKEKLQGRRCRIAEGELDKVVNCIIDLMTL